MNRSVLSLVAPLLLASAIVVCLPATAHATMYLYAELTEEIVGSNLKLTAYGSVEDPECMGQVRVTVRVINPNNNIKAGDIVTGYCYAQTSASYQESVQTVMDGDWEARTIGLTADEYHACQQAFMNVERFTAVFQYSHFNALIQKYEYTQNSSVCVGKCQPPKVCGTQQYAWAYMMGVKISVPVASYCKPAPTLFYSSGQPQCIQRFGAYMGGFQTGCN